MIKSIVFDLDGVLVDTVELHYKAFTQALKLFGFELPPAIHGFSYNGLPTQTKLEMLSQVGNLPRGLHSFINEMKQIYTVELLKSQIRPREEQVSLFRDLKERGFKLAVASNCTRATVDLVLEHLGLKPFLSVVLSKDDVSFPKPDPCIYQTCFKLLGVASHEAMIIEDSRPGILSAQKACPHVSIVRSYQEVSKSWILSEVGKYESTPFLDSRVVEIVIPMAGLGSRFQEAGYQDPKPFIAIKGKPMIHWVIENLKSRFYQTHFTFIVNRQHVEAYQFDEKLSQLAPGSNILSIPGKTEGAACTVLLAMDQIAQERPLVIANSDQWIDYPFDPFLETGMKSACEGLIMTFPASEQKWSYAKTTELGWVTEVAEKKPISQNATVGIYFFQKASDFTRSCEQMIRKGVRTNGEFYVCPVYNELIQKGGRIRVFPIPKSAMHGLGTPEDLQVFLDKPELNALLLAG